MQDVWEIRRVYRNGVVADTIVRKWFARLQDENFNLEVEQCLGRPYDTDEDQLCAEEGNPNETTQDLAEVPSLLKSTI